MEDATSIDNAEMTPVIENIEPSFPSCKLNFCLKKYVTQELAITAALATFLGM